MKVHELKIFHDNKDKQKAQADTKSSHSSVDTIASTWCALVCMWFVYQVILKFGWQCNGVRKWGLLERLVFFSREWTIFPRIWLVNWLVLIWAFILLEVGELLQKFGLLFASTRNCLFFYFPVGVEDVQNSLQKLTICQYHTLGLPFS